MGADPVIALHRITRLPLVPTEPVFAHYPRMKLGVVGSARHYAARLAPLVRDLIAAGDRRARWALTAPPLVNIPAGANLICHQLHRRLTRTLDGPKRLQLIDIEARFDPVDARAFGGREDYARMGIDQRVAARRTENAALVPEPRFKGAPVLFVNDINVTGTQQRFMRRYFDALAPAAVHWLYLIDVDPAIGRARPQLENAINGLSHATVDEFAELLAGTRIEYTGKCLARLFRYPIRQFERLIQGLGPGRRRRLLELTRREGRFGGKAFAAKLALLRGASDADRGTRDGSPHVV